MGGFNINKMGRGTKKFGSLWSRILTVAEKRMINSVTFLIVMSAASFLYLDITISVI